MSAKHYEKARLDALERWNVGHASEWNGIHSDDAVYDVLVKQASDNDWEHDPEQTSADADVIWEYIAAYREAHPDD